MVVDHKRRKTFDLTHKTCEVIDQLAFHLGISRAGVVEMAIRAYAESHLKTEATPQEHA